MAGTLAIATMGMAAAPAAAAPARLAASAPRAAGTLTSMVDGTFTDSLGGVGKVTGTFTPTRFAVQSGKEVAVGTLQSVLTDSAGKPVGTANTRVTTVVLDITAIPGAGNLLGNLLCAVAGLLDGGLSGPVLGSLTILLNAILALLNL